MGDTDARADVSKAYEALEAAASETPAQPISTGTETAVGMAPQAPVEEGGSEPPSRGRDDKGRFAQKAAKAQAAPEEAKPTGKAGQLSVSSPVGASGETVPGAPGTQEPVTPQYRAPQSWKATVREHWGKLPAEVQAEVDRREREYQGSLAEASEAKKGYSAFKEVIAPYEASLRSSGQDPIRTLGNLMQMGAVLNNGPMHHRAQLLAHLTRISGVPVEMLADAFDGTQSRGQQGQAQALDPIQLRQEIKQDLLQDFAQQRHQIAFQKNTEAVATFAPGKEFFEEVRGTMADLIEVSERREKEGRGKRLTLEQAYERACRDEDAHPDIAAVMKQRADAKAATASQTSNAQAKAAASGLKSSPAGPVGAPKGRDILSVVSDAYEASVGR